MLFRSISKSGGVNDLGLKRRCISALAYEVPIVDLGCSGFWRRMVGVYKRPEEKL
jgi:hypothetical protein